MADKGKTPTEDYESSLLARYLARKGALFCHVPNEGKRSYRTAARFRSVGMRRGVPDFLIFESGPWGVGIAVEMKRARGSRKSPEQKRWIENLSSRGWDAFFAHGFDDCLEHFKRNGFDGAHTANTSGTRVL